MPSRNPLSARSFALEPSKGVAQMSQRRRLLDDLNCSQRQGFPGLVLVSMTRQDHDLKRGMPGPDPSERRYTAQPRHDEIEKYTVHRGGFEDVEGFRAVESDQRRITAGTDRFGDDLGHRGVVVDNKNAHGSLRTEYPGAIRARQVAI